MQHFRCISIRFLIRCCVLLRFECAVRRWLSEVDSLYIMLLLFFFAKLICILISNKFHFRWMHIYQVFIWRKKNKIETTQKHHPFHGITKFLSHLFVWWSVWESYMCHRLWPIVKIHSKSHTKKPTRKLVPFNVLQSLHI